MSVYIVEFSENIGIYINHFQIIKILYEKSVIELEIKEIFSKYTNDLIATCAFGTNINSFENPDNEFLKRLLKYHKSLM